MEVDQPTPHKEKKVAPRASHQIHISLIDIVAVTH
jgi:hypothetical protein